MGALESIIAGAGVTHQPAQGQSDAQRWSGDAARVGLPVPEHSRELLTVEYYMNYHTAIQERITPCGA